MAYSEIQKISNEFCSDSQELSKISSARMKDIREEEEESCLSNSKSDDLFRMKKNELARDCSQENKEETMKSHIFSISCSILEKFKNSKPYAQFIEYVNYKKNNLFIYVYLFIRVKD